MPDSSASSYYAILGVKFTASAQQIRRAYRELSKLYHPDTTELPAAIAVTKFQELNEAYATLSSPEKRAAYDLQNGYSRIPVIQTPVDLRRPVSEASSYRSSAYLDPVERSLSAGELFALFILGLTFVFCLVLVVTIGLTRGDTLFQPLTALNNPAQSAEVHPASPLEGDAASVQSVDPSVQSMPDIPSQGTVSDPAVASEAAIADKLASPENAVLPTQSFNSESFDS